MTINNPVRSLAVIIVNEVSADYLHDKSEVHFEDVREMVEIYLIEHPTLEYAYDLLPEYLKRRLINQILVQFRSMLIQTDNRGEGENGK